MDNFEWDEDKALLNQKKHQLSFTEATQAFCDTQRVISIDKVHSTGKETRYFCFGKINDHVATVRFTYRKNKIRIFGAGYWREGVKKYYEKE